ncbi:MAG: hypothetical protein R3E97_05300 [Candidatus Eisenbacteria bacterium]
MRRATRDRETPTHEFVDGKREEIEQGCAAREGLRHGLHEQEVVRTGENEPTGAVVLVDDPLNVGEKVRRALDLIQNRPSASPPRKERGSSSACARTSGRSRETY